MFIVRFQCKGVANVTKKGAKCWLLNEPDGWVPATACDAEYFKEIPKTIKVFDTVEDATEFMRSWGGHPWYYTPNGDFEVIEVKERFEKVFVGYTLIAQETQDLHY